MRPAITVIPLMALLFFAAIFGFFYAWICSTMWAFDLLDPRLAIETMQVVNANVRNLVFFAGFMLSPVVGVIATAVLFFGHQRQAAFWFAAATVVYFAGGMLLTMTVNVPMNEVLAHTAIPTDRAAAAAIWNDYSPRWQFWNQTRAAFSGVAVLLAGYGLVVMGGPSKP